MNHSINKKQNDKKGLFYSIDSLISIFIIITFITAIYIQTDKIKSSPINDIQLEEITSDALFSLKSNGALDPLIDKDKAMTTYFFNNIAPQNICFEIFIYDKNGIIITTFKKDSCTTIEPEKLTITRKPLIVKDEIYLAELRGWYR